MFRPPMRQYLMDGDFFIGAALSTTLMKLALRYVALTKEKKRQNVGIYPTSTLYHPSLVCYSMLLFPGICS